MIQKTEAILLKRQDLRETSLLLTFYTSGFGKIQGVMKGMRGQHKGQYNASPQLFSLNDIVFYERKNRDIYTVSHCDLNHFFGEIRESLEKTSYASYFIELIDSLTPIGEVNEGMYELLENGLKFLCGSSSTKRIARIFEIKLLDLLGLMPGLKSCILCDSTLIENARFSLKNSGVICKRCFAKEKDGFTISIGTINFMEHINRSDWTMVSRIKVAKDVGRQVEGLLQSFLNYHLHLKPKSLEFIRKTQ